MNAVNSVQLFLLVWAFTAVCRADDDISISCEDVTGTVKKEVNFTCSVLHQRSKCCITHYKFLYTEKYKDSAICKQEFLQDPCEQRNSFTCRYTPTTAMTGQFRFFVQSTCGRKNTDFTVNITESVEPDIAEALPKEDPKKLEDPGPEAGPRSSGTVVPTVVGFFIILILIITITIYKTKSNYTKPCGFQNGKFWVHRHDEVNSNCPENVINSPELTV